MKLGRKKPGKRKKLQEKTKERKTKRGEFFWEMSKKRNEIRIKKTSTVDLHQSACQWIGQI